MDLVQRIEMRPWLVNCCWCAFAHDEDISLEFRMYSMNRLLAGDGTVGGPTGEGIEGVGNLDSNDREPIYNSCLLPAPSFSIFLLSSFFFILVSFFALWFPDFTLKSEWRSDQTVSFRICVRPVERGENCAVAVSFPSRIPWPFARAFFTEFRWHGCCVQGMDGS